MKNEGTSSARTSAGFPVTRWSMVFGAAGEAETSLDALCRQYWQPVYAWVRFAGHNADASKDLTQGFFAKLLEKGWLAVADPDKGRFRTFLITALKRHMANEWEWQHARKRGGFAEFVPFDMEAVERIDASENSRDLSPDAMFDRRWALSLLDAALNRVERECPDFERLKDCLTAARGETDYAELAAKLGTSEGAARVAVHRMRKRYRAAIRDEVARTVVREDEIEAEMQVLMRALM